MRPLVVVETNFANQIVLERDGREVAEAASFLLELAEARRIRLVIPIFSLLEAESTFRTASKRRNRIANDLKFEEEQLERSPITQPVAEDLRAFRTSFVEIAREERERYSKLLRSFMLNAETIQLDNGTLYNALRMVDRLELSLPDAVVFASCIQCFQAEPDEAEGQLRIFLTQNSRDFDTEDVRAELEEVEAELVTDYRQCLARIRRTL